MLCRFVFAVAFVAVPLCAAAHPLHAGDRLTYDLTVEAQEHHVPANGATRGEVTLDSAGAGTETIVVSSVDAKGYARADVSLDIRGQTGDAPVVVHRTVGATISPIGEVLITQRVDPLVDQALLLANQAVRDFASRSLALGATWRLATRAQSLPMVIEHVRSATSQGKFRGFPTVSVASVGGGDYASDSATDPVQASVSITGTYYYDRSDHLFVGEALRNDFVVTNGAQGAHVDTTTTINLMLRSFERAAPTPAPSAAPSATPASTPTPIETPTPVPTGFGAKPLPTVTPSIRL
jgi:hypothetical protein